jgi:glycosyltransferase involved in cell wall biosynthesis
LKILLVTDAWQPQTNGVVTTLTQTVTRLRSLNHRVLVIEPGAYATVPCPSYPEIRLALFPGKLFEAAVNEYEPDAIHIATEGPLGLAARAYCARRRLPHTTSYHTQYPEYVNQRYPIPLELGYTYVRWFHGLAQSTLVATRGIVDMLGARGMRNLRLWTRGVDTERFQPTDKSYFTLPRPIALYAGRVAVEKNLEAFLQAPCAGTKVVVGDGPARKDLELRHPTVVFTGYKFGVELAHAIAAADVFVFPSLTDTFGLVMLEAMACGVPVAALPASAPRDVIDDGVSGVIHEDLATAIRAALQLSPGACRRHAQRFTWDRTAHQFLAALAPIERRAPQRPVRARAFDSGTG